ncbi:VPA1267 family protein, partial [Vibrio rotiferianus]
LEAFEVWKATQTDDEFKQIMFRGQLNRIEVAKGIGCGKSALNQNPALKKALKALEDELRGKGVLPPLTDAAKKNGGKPQAYDNTANRKLLDSKRVSSLEAENIELKAKVKELEKRLERFGELSETLYEMGLMPR